MRLINNFEDLNVSRLEYPLSYQKKPVILLAAQIMEPFQTQSLEGLVTGKMGDFLVQGVKGEFYIVDREIFWELYETVDS